MKKYADFAVSQTLELLSIDSPSGYTAAAAEWVCGAFRVLGFEAHLTKKGGVIADLGGVDISALEAFSRLMQDADWARAFWSDFVMMLLFSAIGLVFQAIALSKSVKRPTGIN